MGKIWPDQQLETDGIFKLKKILILRKMSASTANSLLAFAAPKVIGFLWM